MEILHVYVHRDLDSDPDISWLETNDPADRERLRAYRRDEWTLVGVYATAEVQTRKQSTIQTIRSSGLWGVENDSSKDYFDELRDEQLAELREELEAIGFSPEEITDSFRYLEHVGSA